MRKYWEVNSDGQVVIGEVEGAESGYEIKIDHNSFAPFVLYELPLYGGEPMESGRFERIEEAIKVAERWT